MGPETLVTLVAVGLIVAAIAVYLIGITYNLRKASLNLRGVTRGVGVIHERTVPVGEVLGQIAAETSTIADALTALVVKATGATVTAPVEMHDAVAVARSGNGPAAEPMGPVPASMHEAVTRARSSAEDQAPVHRRPAVTNGTVDEDEWEEDGLEDQEPYRPRPLVATPVQVHWTPPVRSSPRARVRSASSGGTLPRTVPEAEGPARGRRRRPAGATAAGSPSLPVDLTDSDGRRDSMSAAVGRARKAVADSAS